MIQLYHYARNNMRNRKRFLPALKYRASPLKLVKLQAYTSVSPFTALTRTFGLAAMSVSRPGFPAVSVMGRPSGS